MLKARLSEHVEIMTPQEPAARGSQFSLRLRTSRERARSIHQRLGERGMVCDWREPDVIRIAPVPLYNSFEEVWTFCQRLVEELT